MLNRFFPRKVSRIAAPKGAVVRQTQSLLQQRGWKRNLIGAWTGSFATKWGTWHGYIHAIGGEMRVQIYDPPAALRRHHKWVCFHATENGWYRIHLQVPPANGDPNAVVLYVEKIIAESFRL